MNSNKESMENSKLITILVQLEEGTKTPFKAHNEILSLFGVVGRSEQYCLDNDKHNKYIITDGFTYCPDCGKEF